MQTSKPTVEIRIQVPEPTIRHREPVTCSIPWPRGMLTDPNWLVLRDQAGDMVPLQTRVLDRWPDGSVRWVLLDWQATVKGDSSYRLQVSERPEGLLLPPTGGIRIDEGDGRIIIDAGPAEFHLAIGGLFTFENLILRSGQIGPIETDFVVEGNPGKFYQVHISRIQAEELGPIRACVKVQGEIRGLRRSSGNFQVRLYFFAGSASVRYSLTLGNPQRADHPGGFWELGSKKSLVLGVACWEMIPDYSFQRRHPVRTLCSPEPGQPLEEFEDNVSVYQESSAGANWQSDNHLNREGIVSHKLCGYRLRWDVIEERKGQRATPIVVFEKGGFQVALAMRYFWQNFPISTGASKDSLYLNFFADGFQELQGGEQKTHEFVVAFGKDTVTAEPLAWVRSPLRVRADPAWYCSTGAVPYLMPEADDPNKDYVRLVRAAIEGEDTFEKKREVVDEYGWRHFGDIYADHEAVLRRAGRGSPDPTPLVSHYNNQYDPLAGFALQFLRSGDFRWWSAMEELAAHVIDIDIYHTDRDKAAYNHGLFWHTVHYTDAGLSTHRSYPRAAGVRGGGPGNEHNYTTGLMLHHFLTGDPRSRQAAIDLAQWVIDMDDGGKTIFRWLTGGDTGLASATVSPLYHGPGRGAGNSIQALLDGYRLTGEAKFLAKAEQLIRRCIHPADDIAARNLLDAERRWSYTVFLQSLGRYLDYKAELGQVDARYAYARAALLHYARWMADNEYPYLEKPEILEYPTETWAAQDMRKSDVFKFAAKHATGDERERFLERSEFFFRYVTKTLSGMETRTLARPVVILLSNGLMHAHFLKHPDEAAPAPQSVYDNVGAPEVFVPQKVRAKKRLLAMLVAAACLGIVGLLCLLL